MLAGARREVLLPELGALIAELRALARLHAALPMLGRTHGQPATPTTLGKEIANVVARLERALPAFCARRASRQDQRRCRQLQRPPRSVPGCRLGSACAAGRCRAWPGVQRVHNADRAARRFGRAVRRAGAASTPSCSISTVICGVTCHSGIFVSRRVQDEVGSSTMPHKVNPIDFENSEGNLGLANALLRHLADKLPVSRWQRDLSDSTVLRNVGVAFGYALLGLRFLPAGACPARSRPRTPGGGSRRRAGKFSLKRSRR